MVTATTDPCAITHSRPMRRVRGRTAEVRCAVCWRQHHYSDAPCIGVVHLDEGVLCIHERWKGGHKHHVGDDGIPMGPDDLDMFPVEGKCSRRHRLRGVPSEIVRDVERGHTVVYLEAA